MMTKIAFDEQVIKSLRDAADALIATDSGRDLIILPPWNGNAVKHENTKEGEEYYSNVCNRRRSNLQ